jgi:SAM-dependent methyltransferase
MTLDNARQHYTEYFTDKIVKFGASPQGADYSSLEAQSRRFEQLAKIIRPNQSFNLIDYGCGYGGFYDFLSKKELKFKYYGFDMIEEMIAAGRDAHANAKDVYFTSIETDLPVADYLVAGGIFNNKFEADASAWIDMILETLARMNRLCSKGFSFDMLTKYSDVDRMAQRPDLFYADPCFLFDHCKRNFSRDVALLHDYGLYDFTILVRKDL